METKNETNGLLKITAMLMIAFAVIGVVVMAAMAGKLARGMTVPIDELIDGGNGSVLRAGTAMLWAQTAMLAVAVIGNLPRLIAGIMGLSRFKKPEKHDFFIVWGVVLLVLGVIGLMFSGWVLSANWLTSFVGGVILPVCYIIGGVWQKRTYIAQKSDAPIVRELVYPAADRDSEPPQTREPDASAEAGAASEEVETAETGE